MKTPTPTPQTRAAGIPTFEEILEQHGYRFDREEGKMLCLCGESFPADSDRFDRRGGYYSELEREADKEHFAHVTQMVDEHFPRSALDRAALLYRIHVPADSGYSSSDEFASRFLRGRGKTR